MTHGVRDRRPAGSAAAKIRNDHVGLSLAAPEFGPRKLYANLDRTDRPGDASVFAVICNPAD